MSDLTTRGFLIGAAVAAAGAVVVASLPIAFGLLVAATVIAAAVSVAVSTQMARLRDRQSLVYRPVYARTIRVHRPVRSED